MAVYLRYIEPIKLAKRENRLEDAIALCLKAIKSTEKESRAIKIGVAPWYYMQAAIVYRKMKEKDKEIEILRRFLSQKQAPGGMPKEIKQRLAKLEGKL